VWTQVDTTIRAERRCRKQNCRRSSRTRREHRGGDEEDGTYGHEEIHKGRGEGAHARQLAGASKLAEMVDGRYRIVSQPPIVVPLRDLYWRRDMKASFVIETMAAHQNEGDDKALTDAIRTGRL
jgi:hypothetical protein